MPRPATPLCLQGFLHWIQGRFRCDGCHWNQQFPRSHTGHRAHRARRGPERPLSAEGREPLCVRLEGDGGAVGGTLSGRLEMRCIQSN